MRIRQHVSRVCVYVILIMRGVLQWQQQQQNFLPVATPALKRDRPNLFCVYVRVGVEKETQTQVFWELIFRGRASDP